MQPFEAKKKMGSISAPQALRLEDRYADSATVIGHDIH